MKRKKELERRLIKIEKRKTIESLSDCLKQGDDEELQNVNIDKTAHTADVLNFRTKSIETAALGMYSSNEEDSDEIVTIKKMKKLKDNSDIEKEFCIHEFIKSDINKEKAAKKKMKKPEFSNSARLRRRRKRLRNKEDYQARKKLKLSYDSENSDSGESIENSSDSDYTPPSSGKYAQKLRQITLQKYRKNNDLRDENFADEKTKEKEKVSKPKYEEEEEEDDEEGEELTLKIIRPKHKQKKRKFDIVKLSKGTSFNEVIDALANKYKVKQIILSFDGDVLSPKKTPKDFDLENGDQIDAKYPEFDQLKVKEEFVPDVD